MKTIIVPLDFSNESLTGLNLSLMMAKKTGANIQMIHVIDMKTDADKELLEKENQQAKRKFENILQNYKEKSNIKGSLTYTIKSGKIFKEVTSFADDYDEAMIVLSTHGKSGFEELFIGGNAYKITSHSKKPVITVRRSKISSGIQKIVLPLDYSIQTRVKVPYTVNLAKLFNSEIHLLSVSTSDLKSIDKKLHQYVKQVSAYIESHKVPFVAKHLQGKNLTDITIDYSQSIDADLISIMTEQEKSVSNLLLGTYAHQMINKSFIPVLSFPSHHLTQTAEDFRTQGILYS